MQRVERGSSGTSGAGAGRIAGDVGRCGIEVLRSSLAPRARRTAQSRSVSAAVSTACAAAGSSAVSASSSAARAT